MVVPQAEGAIQQAREDEAAVGRELDEAHGRVVVVDQRLKYIT